MRHLLLFLFSAISFTSFGRELKGVVMNAEKATIPFANILIYAPNSTIPLGRTATDENGRFTIKDLTQGKIGV